MTDLVILNDVYDAEWIRQNRILYHDSILVSTHEAVLDHLETYKIPVENISSYLQPAELQTLYSQSGIVNQLLNQLDTEFGAILNTVAGLDAQLNFFFDLYRYLGRYEYFNHLKLDLALGRLINIHRVEKAIVFRSHFTASAPSFFSTQVNVFDQVLRIRGVEIEQITSPLSEKRIKIDRFSQRLTKIKRWIWLLLKKPLPLLIKKIVPLLSQKSVTGGIGVWEMTPSSRSIVSLDGAASTELLSSYMGIHDVAFLALRNFGESDVIYDDASVLKLPEAISSSSQLSSRNLEHETEFKPETVLRAILLEDLIHNFKRYLLPVYQLSQLIQKVPVLGAVWVSPPTGPGPKPLIVDYLIQKDVPVVGRQHGGNYGIEQNYPRHFDSDFRWCTYYLSYGFTEEDIKETNPDHPVSCKIIPVGVDEKPISPTHHRRQKVDLLFPISNATYFHRDTVRPLQHELAGNQRRLLRFLNQLSARRIIIKPFHLYDQSTSAFIELLGGLKNVEVMDYLDLPTCFKHFAMGAVIIEYISSPLFESILQDVEVLALNNPILPFNPTAAALLRKRAHIFENVSDLEQAIVDFLEGRLPRLRDNGFAERYLLTNCVDRRREAVQEIFGTI